MSMSPNAAASVRFVAAVVTPALVVTSVKVPLPLLRYSTFAAL